MALTKVDLLEVDLLRTHAKRFILWPRQWQTYSLTHKWTIEPLNKSKVKKIPTSSGIYTILLQPGIAGHISCSYLMYVGKTKSLRRRFGEYLRKERERTARPRISEFLTRYDNYVLFCYTLIDEKSLITIEEGLKNAYVPPLNKQYSGELGRTIGAF